MSHTHDHAIFRPRRDFQMRGNAGGFQCQAMIACGLERTGKAREHVLALVIDRADLAVHGGGGADNLGTENLPYCLMPKADTENRHFTSGSSNQVTADSSLVGGARAGGKERWPAGSGQGLHGAQGVIANNVTRLPQLAQIMDKVEGKTIVIVDQKDHGEMMAF